jgi:hypothetical protein
MRRNVTLAALFLWGSVFSALIWPSLPDSEFGRALGVTVLWAGMYPLATQTWARERAGRYWLMLLVFVPATLVADAAVSSGPARAWLAAALLLVGLTLLIGKHLRSRGDGKASG